MMEPIMTYIALWAPSLVGVLCSVGSIIFAIAKVKDALAQLSAKQLATDVRELVAQNRELTRTNKLLTDKIARIEGYSDALLNEKEEGMH